MITRNRGQGSIEFLAIFLGFAALFLGLFEMTRLYRTKHVLNTATFAAARAGALHNARVGPMNAELANGLVPLFMESGRSVDALLAARQRALALAEQPGVGIQIVSPTRQAYAQLRATQWIRSDDDDDYRWQEAIPNDNLQLRPRNVARLESSAGPVEITLQDANLLRVRSLWCHRLITPILDRAIFGVLTSPMFITEKQRVCSALSSRLGWAYADGFYVAVSADAVVRMQGPIFNGDLPAN